MELSNYTNVPPTALNRKNCLFDEEAYPSTSGKSSHSKAGRTTLADQKDRQEEKEVHAVQKEWESVHSRGIHPTFKSEKKRLLFAKPSKPSAV